VIFTETALSGAFILDVEERRDSRGLFARTYCRDEFEAHGLDPELVQGSVSFNNLRGTVRGMHFQFPPAAETKVVRCTRGALADVIVDLRPESPTYLQHALVELTADNRRSLYVPRRFAHGFQVLQDGTEVAYLTGARYAPTLEGGLRYDDPALAIGWPLPPIELSERDRTWPLLEQAGATIGARMASADVPGAGSRA
jgi:dTDP-4-dehydrorhamnose 3,5-epimerase